MEGEHHDHLDPDLVDLETSLSAGEPARACRQLAALALDLDARFWREERAIAMVFARTSGPTSPIANLRREHAVVRELLAVLAATIDRGDLARGIEALTALRSVLLLHRAKEALLLQAHAAC